jgi:hypothetical protein
VAARPIQDAHGGSWQFSALAITMLGCLGLVNNGHNARSVESRMSEITKDTHATLHQLVAGEDTIQEQGRLKDLVLRYISLTGGQRPEYFITIDQVEYLPKQIKRWAREFGLI